MYILSRLLTLALLLLSLAIAQPASAQSIPLNASIFVNKKGDTLFVEAGADRDDSRPKSLLRSWCGD